MTTPTAAHEPVALPLMRSGTAARLAGLSPSTLRIWEHRYGVVAPPKSATGQRTYSMQDIERLRLIRRLTLEGHPIGSVARLDVDALVSLSSGRPVPTAAVQRVVVVGHAAARKLKGWLRPSPERVFDDLDDAERDLAQAGTADVLVVQVPALHASMPVRVMALRDALAAPHVVVVYSFGAEAVADALRAAGATVRRDPVAGRELADLIAASRPAAAAAAAAPGVTQALPRHYSDAELVALTEMPSAVACECPRHLAEIVSLLVGFEHYSTQCAAQSPRDAALHRHLHEVTGSARTMLEQALARVVLEERLVLETRP